MREAVPRTRDECVRVLLNCREFHAGDAAKQTKVKRAITVGDNPLRELR